MQKRKREITKEQYERAVQNKGYISEVDKADVFTESEIWGYGVYGNKVVEDDGKYYVHYSIGDTCD